MRTTKRERESQGVRSMLMVEQGESSLCKEVERRAEENRHAGGRERSSNGLSSSEEPEL